MRRDVPKMGANLPSRGHIWGHGTPCVDLAQRLGLVQRAQQLGHRLDRGRRGAELERELRPLGPLGGRLPAMGARPSRTG